MNFSLFIAKRYLRFQRQRNFINILGMISFISISLSTMSLILALSVFNGLEGLMKSLYSSFDPDLKICLQKGKFFYEDEQFIKKIKNFDEINKITLSLEDNILLKNDKNFVVTRIKGVSNNFWKDNHFDQQISYGKKYLSDPDRFYLLMGNGIRRSLKIYPDIHMPIIKGYYPKRNNKPTLSKNLFIIKKIRISGFFSIDQEIDNKYSITDIGHLRSLLKDNKIVSSVDISLKNKNDIAKVKSKVVSILPPNYKVMDLDDQTAGLLTSMKSEKLAIKLIFAIIILVASLNLFFVMTMSIINKKKDFFVLNVIGASPNILRKIVFFQSIIVSIAGCTLGMILAYIISMIQQKFHIVSLGVYSGIINHYPIENKISDYLFSFSIVLFFCILSSIKPAYEAGKIEPQR